MENFWITTLGAEEGQAVIMALRMLTLVNREKLQLAIQELDRATTLGPLLDPSAWLGNARFNNSREYRDLLVELVKLRGMLPDTLPSA